MKTAIDCILLVDDDRVVNLINRVTLGKRNIANSIFSVENGKEALDFIREQGAYRSNGHSFPKPSVILLDLNMPVMNGWEFLEAYRTVRKEKHMEGCKLYVLTSSPNPDDISKAAAIKEVDGYFTKPLSKALVEQLANN